MILVLHQIEQSKAFLELSWMYIVMFDIIVRLWYPSPYASTANFAHPSRCTIYSLPLTLPPCPTLSPSIYLSLYLRHFRMGRQKEPGKPLICGREAKNNILHVFRWGKRLLMSLPKSHCAKRFWLHQFYSSCKMYTFSSCLQSKWNIEEKPITLNNFSEFESEEYSLMMWLHDK